jgi:hypothetical protein
VQLLIGGLHASTGSLPCLYEGLATYSGSKPPHHPTNNSCLAPEPGQLLEEREGSPLSLKTGFDPGGVAPYVMATPNTPQHRRPMQRVEKFFLSHQPHPSASQLTSLVWGLCYIVYPKLLAPSVH